MQTQPTKEEALHLHLKQATDTIKKLEAMLARTDGRFNCEYEQPVSVGALEKALTIFDSLVWYRMDTAELFYKNREEAVKQITSMALLAKEEEIKALREALIKLNEVVIKYHPHCYMPENEDLYTAIHESKEIIKRTKQP